ncbi:DUF3574 domain-containing protein [Streptomyces luteolus]|uniref:DUF3574 domain-containing protein n=1 Tax=Streptomyces luteolus TaxID=3043615 RepID=A0ABT6T602_9ACTN|nr:DUF3574 domain-containing protein [Streptomyces sp. B-S-A12]MDI3423306.1 DUF3574 domain-containing protein [Streptomyces sp. B-S-A12]
MPRTASARTRLAVAALALTTLTVGAPAAYASLDKEPVSAAGARGDAYVETRLMFGTERPDGGPDVTDRQFMDFVDREVTPRFPEGLTVQTGHGQWRDAHGTVERERSYELVLLYPAASAAERDPQVERIRDAYIRAYGQEAVARIDDRLRVDF